MVYNSTVLALKFVSRKIYNISSHLVFWDTDPEYSEREQNLCCPKSYCTPNIKTTGNLFAIEYMEKFDLMRYYE